MPGSGQHLTDIAVEGSWMQLVVQELNSSLLSYFSVFLI